MSNTMCYVGRKACGSIVAVSTDKPEYKKINAKELAQWIREGLTIERMTVTEVHETPLGCSHNEPKKNKREAQLAMF